MVIDASDSPTHRTRPGPGTCCLSGHGRGLEGSLFRRGALSRLPRTVFRCTPTARHRARPVPRSRRTQAAFRLARIHFQKGQLDDALQALARIKGTLPEEIRGDVEFLRANVYMATGQPSEAVEVLAQLKSNERLAGFVAYNLGIALLQDGRQQEAIEQLNMAGQLPAGDPAGFAIRDKSNLVLGTMLFESGNFERARQSLDRVHLEGPFSNQALLRAGWAEASAHQYDRALVPWNILVDREPTDAAVQEVMLAVPHAYASMTS